MRYFWIPLGIFMLVVLIGVGSSITEQDIRNVMWRFENSTVVKNSGYSLTCVAVLTVLAMLVIWLSSPYRNYPPDIGKAHRQVETDMDGCYIGYRYLEVGLGGYQSVTPLGRAYGGTQWGKTGYLEAHVVPDMYGTEGIYAAKTKDSPVLEPYKGRGRHLVKVKLWGASVVECEYGYRGHKALVIEDYGEQ